MFGGEFETQTLRSNFNGPIEHAVSDINLNSRRGTPLAFWWLSCRFQTNLAGPEELRMELAGLGSLRPYAPVSYMSNGAYSTCAIYAVERTLGFRLTLKVLSFLLADS